MFSEQSINPTLCRPLSVVTPTEARGKRTGPYRCIDQVSRIKGGERPDLYNDGSKGLTRPTALQISLDLCIPEKELAKTRSQISFIYFQSHS
jgi:hypothetical protein